MKVGIVGLGFVGLSFAAVLGSKGYHVIGIDSDAEKVNKIRLGKTPFYEPKLDVTLQKALKNFFSVSQDISLAVNECELIFITVGTPQSRKEYIDLSMIKSAVGQIGKALSKTKNYPIIIIKSTVIPSTTLDFIKPILEKRSGKTLGSSFGLITNPEFLREGMSIQDTINPHLVVIGGEDKKSIRKVKQFYYRLYGPKVPIMITNHNTAELIKYANNSFLATKISFINQIANICQSLPGTNVDDVAKAIGVDPRIGGLFLQAGPGFGGSCLPKDLQTMIKFSSKIGNEPVLLKAVQRANQVQFKQVFNLIKKTIGKINGKKITILGLSFKENSDDLRESVSVKLIDLLLKNKARIVVHDPIAIANTKLLFKNKISYAKSVRGALINSNCAVIMTPWKQYSHLKDSDFLKMKEKMVIDTRRILKTLSKKITYRSIGIAST